MFRSNHFWFRTSLYHYISWKLTMRVIKKTWKENARYNSSKLLAKFKEKKLNLMCSDFSSFWVESYQKKVEISLRNRYNILNVFSSPIFCKKNFSFVKEMYRLLLLYTSELKQLLFIFSRLLPSLNLLRLTFFFYSSSSSFFKTSFSLSFSCRDNSKKSRSAHVKWGAGNSSQHSSVPPAPC